MQLTPQQRVAVGVLAGVGIVLLTRHAVVRSDVVCAPHTLATEAAGDALRHTTRRNTTALPAAAPPAAAPPAAAEKDSLLYRCQPHPATCTGACEQLLGYIQGQRAASSWKNYYNEVADFLLSKGGGGSGYVMVEVGTAFGGLADHLLTRIPSLHVHVVDPFLGGYDPDDQQSHIYNRVTEDYHLNAATFSFTWARAMAYDLGGKHGCRYHLHRMLSTEAAAYFDASSVDAIFIDGLHTRDGVLDDVAAWLPAVKRGAPMMFNDYAPVGHFVGVREAVDEYAAKWHQVPPAAIGTPSLFNVVLYAQK